MSNGETIGFRMVLHPGQATEYRRRHAALWPELRDLLKAAGISDYRIFLDPATHHLFAILTRAPDHRMADLADEPVMRRWWAHMADIMETDSSGAPKVTPLDPMFHLP
ncbi:L-rhamnose mutarotase [Arboricoccus pini]|uniref:L-rhamnose mutarotase n=1 Tax=Arboricoccus pini TaxID=1963835 RepID=A0A212RD22_9PROT|nr:L-rhamnose mutarotase [Arboricoccus pini]SNB70174.1 L-rhamnose mutarotase [Arboricoccus pini]